MAMQFKFGDRVHIEQTRDTFEHDATVIAFRVDGAKRCIGVRLDDYDSDIPWWYEPSGLKRIEQIPERETAN